MERYFRELKRGSTKMIILSLLEREPMYGYEISKKVREMSDDYFKIPEGALYTALHSLEKDGFIKGNWVEKDGRERKYYSITSKGQNFLRKTRKEWEILVGKLSPFLSPSGITIKKFSLSEIFWGGKKWKI